MQINNMLIGMFSSARQTSEFLYGIDRAAYDADPKTQDAVTLKLILTGAAVKDLPKTWKSEHSDVNWQKLVALSDQLTVRYYADNLASVWEAAKTDIPALQHCLESIVTPLLADSEEEKGE